MPAVAIGAQQVRQHEGIARIAGIALGVAGAIARPAGLDRIGGGWRRPGGPPRARCRPAVPRAARWPPAARRQRRRVRAATRQSLAVVLDVQALEHVALGVDDTHGMAAVGPVHTDEDAMIHRQPPRLWGKTVRVGSRGGKLIDWRSGWSSVALHPVARCGSSGTSGAAGLMRAVEQPAPRAVTTRARKSARYLST